MKSIGDWLTKKMRIVPVLSLLLFAVPAFAANLLTNPGYEADGVGGVQPPTSWAIYGLGAGTYATSDEQINSGSYSVKCIDDNATASYVHQSLGTGTVSGVTISDSKVYDFSAQIYDNVAGVKGYLRIFWYASGDASGTALTSPQIGIDSVDLAGWQNLGDTDIVPPAGACSCSIRLYIKDDVGSSGAIYLDDAEFIEVLEAIPPCGVSNLTAMIVSGKNDGKVDLKWTAPGDDGTSGGISGGEIKILASTYSITSANFDSIAENPYYTYLRGGATTYSTQATEHSYTMTGLYPGTTYYFAIKVKDAAGNWSSWSYAGVNTKSTAPACDLAPDIVTVSAPVPADGQLTVNWTEPSNFDVDYYIVEVSSFGTHPVGDFSSIIFSSQGYTGWNSYPSTAPLTNFNTYYYRITTYDWGDGADGLFSAVISSAYAYTNAFPCTAPPAAPTGFAGTGRSISSINWSWTDVTGEGGYILRYSTSATVIAGLSAGTTFWVETGLSVNTSNYRIIVATNTAGYSPLTSVTTSWTLANPPVNSTCTAVWSSSVTITWEVNSNPGYTHYGLSYSTYSDFSLLVTTQPANYAQTLTANTTAVTDLSGSTTYYFRVWAYNGISTMTAFDTVITTLTAGAPPSGNLLADYNYDFEDPVDFSMWTKDGTASSIVIANTSYSGSKSCKFATLTSAYSGRGIVSSTPTAAAGTQYAASAWAFVEASGGGVVTDAQLQINIRWYNSTGGLIYTDASGDITLDAFNTWQQISFSTTAPAGTVRAAVEFEAKESVDNNNNAYVDYAELMEFVPDTIPPAAINNLTAMIGTLDGEVDLKWTAPGDDGWSGGITNGTLQIKASTYPITSSNYPSVISNGYYTYSVSKSTTYTTQGTEHTYTMANLYAGTTYYFAVKVSDGDNWSSWSNSGGVNPKSSAPACDLVPTIISNFSAAPTYGAITLSWTEPTATDIEKYVFYRDSTTPYDFADEYSFEVSAPASSHIDTGLEEGVTYYYRVSTLDFGPGANGLYSVVKSSSYSSVISALIPIEGYEPSSQRGNEFVIDSTYAKQLNNLNEAFSYRFIAQNNRMLEKVYLYGYRTGSGAYYTLGIETNDAATGKPSGYYAWSGSSAIFVNTIFTTGSNWSGEIALLNSGALSVGTTYHIVVRYKENVDAANYISLYYTSSKNEKWVNGLTSNDYRTAMRGYSGAWADLQAEPVYILSYSDSSFEGNPYSVLYSATYDKIFGLQYAGEDFTLTQDEKINSLNVYIARNGSPADHLYYRLETTASVLISSGIVISSSSARTSMNEDKFYWKTGVLLSSKTLSAGDYRLYFVSTGSVDDSNCYAVNCIGHYTDPSSGAETYDGTNSVFTFSPGGGDAWYKRSYQDIGFLIVFDETPPADIDSLAAAAGKSYGTADLTWTSPGDDLNSGKLVNGSFEIRYSTSNDSFATNYFTETMAANCSPFEAQSYTVGNLQGGEVYYFAVITKDEADNSSGISNIVSQAAQSDAVFDIIGNKFAVEGSGGVYNIDAEDKKVSYRFTAQNSKTVNTIHVYMGETGSKIRFDVRLENDSNGSPGGLAWAGAENWFETDNSGNWHDIILTTPGEIVKGRTYHIVTQYREVNPGWAGLVSIDDKNKVYPRGTKPRNEEWINGILNPDRYSRYYNGSAWSDEGTYSEPVYVLEFDDGTSEGNPYYSGSSASGNAYEENRPGEKINVLTTQNINGARIYIKETGNAVDHLFYALYNISDGLEVVSGTAAYKTELTDSFQWWDVPFRSTYTLTAGKSYRFYLYSPLSLDTNNCYKISDLNTGNTGEPVFTSITFGGADTCFTKSADSGATWNNNDGKDLTYQFAYDKFPPADIDDVSAKAGPTKGSVYLSWTSPCEDNNDPSSGSVTEYEVKYATKSFGYSDWNSSFVHTVAASSIPSPYSPGSKQTMSITTGLTPGSTYYFRLRAVDDMLNFVMDVTFPQASSLAQPIQEVDHIVISEFSTGGVSSTRNEFVEIYNPLAFDVDISGYELRYASADNVQPESAWYSCTVPDGTILKPNGFYLFGSSYYDYAIPYNTKFTEAISNAGGHFCVYDSANEVMDRVRWGVLTTTTTMEGTAVSTASWVKGGSYKRNLSTPSACDTDENSADFSFAVRAQPDNFLSPAQPDETWPSFIAPAEERIEFFFTARNFSAPDIKQQLVNLIDRAASHVYMTIYTLTAPEVITALNNAADRGVIVRLIVDDYTTDSANTDIADELSDNVKWTVNDEKLNADDSYIMHDKIAVIDGNTVYTGSTNFTYGGFGPQDNNSVVLVSTALAKNYEEEFREMWSGYYKGYKKNSPVTSMTIASAEVKNYFSPQNSPVENVFPDLAASAKESVLFSIFTFTHKTLGNKFYDLHQGGIVVNGIFDRFMTANPNTSGIYGVGTGDGLDLNGKGMRVRKKSGLSGDIMHNKVMIIDQEKIVTGSTNWTPAGGKYNDENTVVITDKRLARQFVKYFKNLWSYTSDEDGTEDVEENTTAPRAISGISAYNTGTKAIALQWTKTTETDFSRYYIFVSSLPISPIKISDGVDNNGNGAVDEGNVADGNLIPETVVTNPSGTGVVVRTCGGDSLVPGTAYYFAVLQTDKSANESYCAPLSTAGPVVATTQPDTAAPAAIADLTVVSGSNYGEIILSWTASGDDGNTGIASEYDIRRATFAITSASFSAAARLSNVPLPLPSGTAESLTVQNMYPGRMYYFALKVLDESGLSSAISNTAGAFPKSQPVVINEFIYDAVGTDTGKEWIELFNYSTFSVSLQGWSVEKANSEDWSAATTLFTISDKSVSGESYFLCAQSGLGSTLGADFYLDGADEWKDSAGLNNSSKCGVRLKDNLGNIIDYVGYNWASGLAENNSPVGPATAPKSISRKTAGTDTNDNYADFEVLAAPTPTPSAGPDTNPPEKVDTLSSLTGSSAGEITLSWKAPADIANTGLKVNNNIFAGYILKFATIPVAGLGTTAWWKIAEEYIQQWPVASTDAAETQTLHLRPGTTYYFLIKTYDGSYNQNVSDFSNSCSAKALEGNVGSSIRINEIAPAQYSSDGSDWIEFYNAGSTVNIFGFEVYEAYTSTVSYMEKVEGNWTFPAGDYLVLRFNQTRNMTVPRQTGARSWELFTDNAGLVSADNVIILKDSAGGWIDAVCYADRSSSLSGTSKFREAYNGAIQAGQWSGILATGDNDAVVEKYCAPSVYLSRGRSIARDENSTDGINPEHKNWYLSKSVTRGVANPSPDISAPAQISDFSVATGINRGTVRMSWAAPGNDAAAGSAAGYVVRYGVSPITDNEGFDRASNLNVVSKEAQSDAFYWIPQASGSSEVYIAGGLNPGGTYYFVIVAEDETLNRGGLSNGVSAMASSAIGSNVRINEVVSLDAAAQDWVELYFTQSVDITDWAVYNIASGEDDEALVKTFSQVDVSTGDYLVLNLNESGTDETSAKGSNGFWDVYGDYDLKGFEGLVILRDASGNIVDFVAYSQSVAPDWDALWADAVEFNQWSPEQASVSNAVDWSAGTSAKSIARDEVSADTDDTGAASSDWYVVGYTKGSKNKVSAPYPISYISALAGSVDGEVQLSWIAPSDAAGYEVRYATYPTLITNYASEAWWNSVGAVKGFQGSVFFTASSSSTLDQGIETKVVTGLYPERDFYFCVKVQDYAGNVSSISTHASIYLSDSTPPLLEKAIPSWVRSSVSSSSDTVSIFWQPGPSDVVTYFIERKIGAEFSIPDTYTDAVSTAGTSLTLNLLKGTTYTFRISAIDYAGKTSTTTLGDAGWLKITVYCDYAFPTISALPNAAHMKGNDFKFNFTLSDSNGIQALAAVTPRMSYYRSGTAITEIVAVKPVVEGGTNFTTYSGTFTVPASFVSGGNFSYFVEYGDYASRSTRTPTINVTVSSSQTFTWAASTTPYRLTDGNALDGETSIVLGAVDGTTPSSLKITQTFIPSSADWPSFPAGTSGERVDVNVNAGMPVMCWDIDPKDADGYDMNVTFANPVSITLLYLERDGVVFSSCTATAAVESRLKAYFLDERNHIWRYIGGTQNTTVNTLAFNFPHLSRFALFAATTGEIKPVQRFLTAITPVDFASATKVIIYDPRGRKVVTLTTGSPLVWYGADRETSAAVPASQMVESGAYIYESTGAGGAKATGVIIVVK